MCIIFHLVTLRQQVSILKTSQSEEHSIAEPRMRAEDLRVIMIEGDGGQGNKHNNKQQHKDAETEVARPN